MWWICTSSGTLSEESYSRLSDINAGEDHITYPCAMLTIYHYDTKIRYHRKDFLCHEGCFIIAHPLRYCRTSLEENRHLEIIPVILSAAKDDRYDLQMHRHDWLSRLSLRRGPLIGL